MKRALTLVVLIVIPSIILAQGTVTFGSSSMGLVQQWSSSSDSTLVPVPVSGGYVELIAASVGTALNPLGDYGGSSGFVPAYFSLAGFLAANPGWAVPYAGTLGATPLAPVPIAPAPGRFFGPTATIANIGTGADADYVVIGWTGPYPTYDAAYAADQVNPNSSLLGISAIATTHTGDPSFTPPTPSVLLSVTFQGITLAPAVIPEPTTFLLAGLGALSLLLFRRRG